jgi:hypothetical protein
MLTYHHYLLSGFAAVSCATASCFSAQGFTVQNELVHNESVHRMSVHHDAIQNALTQEGMVQAGPASLAIREALEIAYRGSGRLNDEPVKSKSIGRLAAHSSSLAHRGSGRVYPQFL